MSVESPREEGITGTDSFQIGEVGEKTTRSQNIAAAIASNISLALYAQQLCDVDTIGN